MSPSNHLVKYRSLENEVSAVARKYRQTNHYFIRQLNKICRNTRPIIKLIPTRARSALENSLSKALIQAYRAAARSQIRQIHPRLDSATNLALVAATGAAGGIGGLATTVPELPVTIGLFFRSMQRVATLYDRDIKSETTRQICLSMFASGKILESHMVSENDFIGIRLLLQDQLIQTFATDIAPRLLSTLSPRLFAPPVIGAATGSALNMIYIKYYENLAHSYFQLARLAEIFGAERTISEFIKQTIEPIRSISTVTNTNRSVI